MSLRVLSPCVVGASGDTAAILAHRAARCLAVHGMLKQRTVVGTRSVAYTPKKTPRRKLSHSKQHNVWRLRTVVGTSSVSYSPKMPEGRSAQLASPPRPLAPSTNFSPAWAVGQVSRWGLQGWTTAGNRTARGRAGAGIQPSAAGVFWRVKVQQHPRQLPAHGASTRLHI